MSKEDEVNLRIVAAIVAAACHVLGVDRGIWLKGKCKGDVVLHLHLCAMNLAAVRLGVPMCAREQVMLWATVNLWRTPFERELVNFYVEQGKKVLGA